MNPILKKQLIITKINEKTTSLLSAYQVIKGNPDYIDLIKQLTTNINILSRMIDEDNNLLVEEKFIKENYPVLYFSDFDFTDTVTFYNQIFILNPRELEVLASDNSFINLLASAPAKEILHIFITFAQDQKIYFNSNSFFPSEEDKPNVLETIFDTTSDWNKEHLNIRSSEEKRVTIGDRLKYLTKINNDDLKNMIFTDQRVLMTLMNNFQSENLWFSSEIADKLPEYATLKVIKYLLKNRLFHLSYLNELIRKYEVANHLIDNTKVLKK